MFKKGDKTEAEFIIEAQGENEKITLSVSYRNTDSDPFVSELDEISSAILKSKTNLLESKKKNTIMYEIKL